MEAAVTEYGGEKGDGLDRMVWHALHSNQSDIGQCLAKACRYGAEFAPFAAIADTGQEAVAQLRSLLASGETIYLAGDKPERLDGLAFTHTVPCLQMVLPEDAPIAEEREPGSGEPLFAIVPLGVEDVPAMLELTTLTVPGPFRTRTYEMGNYAGIRENGVLVAMAGERFAVGPFREISAVCTHPAHTGRGYAAAMLAHHMRRHRRLALRSCLHVASANERAIAVYKRAGFVVEREVLLQSVTRIG